MFGSFWSVIAFTRANKGIVWNTSEETNCWPDQDWLRSISERLGTTVQECLRLPRHAMKRPPGLRTVQRFLLYLAEFRVLQSVWNNKTQYETMRNMTNPSSWSPFKSCDLGFSCVHSLSGRFKRGDMWWHKMIQNVRMIMNGCKVLWKQGSCWRCRSWRAVSKLCWWSVFYLELLPWLHRRILHKVRQVNHWIKMNQVYKVY